MNTGFLWLRGLFKLLGGEINLVVSRYTFVCFILHIHHILHFCVPHPEFLEPKWSQVYSGNTWWKNAFKYQKYFSIIYSLFSLHSFILCIINYIFERRNHIYHLTHLFCFFSCYSSRVSRYYWKIICKLSSNFISDFWLSL